MAYLKEQIKINRKRPTIGITGPDKGGGVAWFFTALGVRLAGGKPVRITPGKPRTADGLQALIIGGGADVDPDTYQKQNVVEEYLARTIQNKKISFWRRIGRFVRWIYYPGLFLVRKLFSRKIKWTIDRNRDHLEFQLLNQAVKKNLPVMGICRGSQLLNVYFGGSLYQDINSFYSEEPNPISIFPVKKIRIKKESKLANILGAEKLKVNAIHHQAIKDPGQNIIIVAKEANGVVQAVENSELPYVVGVQWHPEYLPQRPEQRRLFQALVHHAKNVNMQIEEQDMREALSQPKAPQIVKLEQKELSEFKARK
ncbi:gamma-glutamyl-gamma-aminobutyrate hydrolase family protein [Adhaeribacter aquaticus]|uniref:gamma-glutamyl-gamma-aminobutyrate hydrolase family protein n=1 Tax=Adhaeribacter aquaticus TaxID=299567 RepID=UPI0003FE2977|nr:type 1 glutamine amidotransferase [Adhaeribacter aquaticus]